MRLLQLILSLLLACLVQASAMNWTVVKVEGRRYVPVSDVATFYRLTKTKASAKEFVLTAPGRRIVGRAGGRDVTINGVKYILCFPVITRNGEPWLSAMDVTKIIEPVLRPGKIKTTAPLRTVILDPGHGGHDSGAVGPLGREKAYALDVGLRARALLIRAGYDVKMTRTTDVFIPLEKRSAFANKFPNAVFVSIHFNKSSTSGGTGIETFALAPRGVPSMDEENLSYSDFKENPGNARDGENIALAAAIHSAMVRNLPVTDRGIKRARFHVIRATRIPSVLIEGGFVNNPQDSRLIANPEYRQRLAVSILQGVEAYKRSLNPSAPAPSALVSGAQPTSIPDLAPINPTAIPEIPPVPAGSPSPAPEKSTTADPQENSSATASVEPTPEPIKPLPANWHLGYPPGRKKPSAEPEPVESHEE